MAKKTREFSAGSSRGADKDQTSQNKDGAVDMWCHCICLATCLRAVLRQNLKHSKGMGMPSVGETFSVEEVTKEVLRTKF